MSRKDRASSEASLQAKCLIMSDLQIPHSRVGGKSDLHNYRPEKKNTNGPILLLSCTPLPRSLSLYLCRSLSSCSLSLSFRHPSFISILSPTAAWWVITPHSDERSGVYEGLFFFFFFLAPVCASLPVCAHPVCLLYGLLKWYGRRRGGGKVIQPTCY